MFSHAGRVNEKLLGQGNLKKFNFWDTLMSISGEAISLFYYRVLNADC